MNPANALLKSVFGFDSFRPGQQEIVDAVVSGRDVLAIMPTGGGKSLCYQLPALVRDGLTVVISPLIALMRDQVAALREAGVEAGSLSSANDPDETDRVFSALEDGRLKLLYLAPERLASAGTQGLLVRSDVRLLAVDEAHCVSQWGHDFRPDYLRIGELIHALGGVQTAAFTATADEGTRGEISRRLFAEPPEVFLRGFDRPNLRLAFEAKNAPQSRILNFVKRRPGQSGIIYCSSRKKTETLAAALARDDIDALAYHAGLDAETRSERQDRFARADGVVMTATVAFGMGVDKPDIRFVIHADLPKTVESYYQEIGRAGRDGLPADTLTLYGIDDIKLRRRQIDESDAPEDRRHADHQRLNALLSLAEAPACRRQTLLAYFGETRGEPCGNCDLCENPPKRYDGTELVQKALSAMVRSGERFGVEHLTNILRGDLTDRISQLGHDKLPTFGCGTELEKGPWRGVFHQTYALGYAAVSETGSWSVTESGWEVLRGNAKVMLRHEAERPKREARPRPTLTDPADAELFDALRGLRTKLAKARGVPAYVIFTDASLHDMVERKPRTLDEMARCNGVGAKKLSSFGAAFLEVFTGEEAQPQHPARQKLANGDGGALFDALVATHATLTRGPQGQDKYMDLSKATLAEIARTRPQDEQTLARIRGMGDQKTERFGAAFLSLIRATEE
ncbi:DNA helicase RecQ [Rhodobacteraceae bacterium NNCM2]|nr:DNA helicase RecQ [Coraliihabitans acroporae]